MAIDTAESMSALSSFIVCPICSCELPAKSINQTSLNPCPGCGRDIYAVAFPALFREVEKGRSAETLMDVAEASCFYHHDKRAASACEACGRFLCNLCDIKLDQQHLCSSCVAISSKKGKLRNLNNHRTLYNEIAFAWALYPVIFVWPMLITPFIALYTSIRHWNAPGSIIQRSKAKFIWAIILSLLEIAGGLVVIAYLLMRKRHG